ncbi:K+-dependent Na+/Ca+ exchanger-like protein [Candidatus Magnetomorum sp. HK-1]|nr:K+-dependent Na+/Ca+ exchanger-like protein [Candidatus Magnetomorum sp. HK-1]
MSAFMNISIIVITLLGLWKGAEWLVESSVVIARKIGISELVIGLTIVAIGTAAPEFAVSAISAIKGHGNISIGNVVGSNIFNLGFILGTVALVKPLTTTGALVKRDGSVLIGTTLILLFLLHDLCLTVLEGVFLIALLTMYISFLIYQKKSPEEEIQCGEYTHRHAFVLIGGLLTILISSHFLVESASELARHFGISEWVIGVTIVAMGTSTPEFVTSLVAILKGHHGLSAGNLVGSDIFNLLGVLGLAGTLNSMTISPEAYSSLYFLVGMVCIVVFMMRTGWQISRFEGGLLVLFSCIRWALDFYR